MKEIINNNIKGISPKGNEFFFTFSYLKEFISNLKGEWVEVTTDKHFGLFDKLLKGINFKTKKFSHNLSIDYFKRLRESLEQGKEITIKEWKFQVI